ncbi:MAG: hypothetical protein SGJ09_12065 [Phycisphaerae bacterium]|nr:hypothetical protein [Phycisphaerae bacterium]
MKQNFAIALCAVLVPAASGGAAIVSFTDQKAAWPAAAGGATKLDFVNSQGGQFATVPQDYYAWAGITLASKFAPEGCNWLLNSLPPSDDGWVGQPGTGFTFEQPAVNFVADQHAFAIDRWAAGAGATVSLSFYSGGQLVASTSSTLTLENGFNGIHFWGWTTDFGFDRVVVNLGYFDNLYVSTVPSPGAVGLLGLFGCKGFSRRRRW